MQEREINLLDLVVEVFLKWRVIVVWMVAGAVLLGVFSYVRSWRDSIEQANQVEDAQKRLEQLQAKYEMNMSDEMDEEISRLLQWSKEKLTEQQISNVEYTLVYEELLEKRLAYQDQSVLLQMDPDNVYKASVTFYISSQSKERSYSIEDIYEDLIRSAGMSQYIADQVGITAFGVTELVSLQSEVTAKLDGKDSFTVEVIYYSEQGCRDIINAIQNFMDSRYDELADLVGEYVITALEPSFAVVSNTGVLNTQRNYYSDIIYLQNTIIGCKDRFSLEEWQYYDVLLNGKITELTTEKVKEAAEAGVAANGENKEELFNQAQSIEKLEMIIERGVTVSPGISMRYVLMGAILAAFVYVFIIFMTYILNTKIRSSDNLQEIYGVPQFGLIPGQDNKKKPFGFVDEWILTMRNRNKRRFSKDEAVNLVTVAVKMSAEREKLSTVYLVGCNLKEHAMEVCEQIKDSLYTDNIQVDILNNVIYDAQAMCKLENAKGVVLVETVQSTLYGEITQELELLKRQEVKVLGGVIVE